MVGVMGELRHDFGSPDDFLSNPQLEFLAAMAETGLHVHLVPATKTISARIRRSCNDRPELWIANGSLFNPSEAVPRL